MRTLLLLLAATCAGLSAYGTWIVWTILHSAGDDNPFAIVGAFVFMVGSCFALLFAWLATRFKATRA